ncbi:Ig-like domain-containing protein [Paenibacillus sp. FSL L8-0709]
MKPTAVTSPKGGKIKITYSSTNSKIATVKASGLVTAGCARKGHH